MKEKLFGAGLRPHGANPEKLYAAVGLPMPERVLDFSSNANVLPWRLPPLDWLTLMSDYPDDEALELRSALAEREGLPPSRVLVTNGSNEALYLLASFFAGKRVAVLQPTYGEYRRAFSAFGAEVSDVFSLPDLAQGFDLSVVCNPNNPTGDFIPFEALNRLAAENPRGLFLADEAYIDFLRPREPGGLDPSLPNVLRLRSLTKTYRLSGLRAGFLLAPEAWCLRLKERQPTWSVNAPAQAAALRFLQDGDFLERTRRFYSEETPRLMRQVERAGYRVRPSRTNFFLAETDDDEALMTGLLRRGIVVRHTRSFPGLDGSCVRIATRLPEENDLLAAALAELRG